MTSTEQGEQERLERPRSLWRMTGPECPSDTSGTDTTGTDAFGAARYDTVVVGAGLTGLTTAVLLARAGQRVAVIEGRSVGAVTTGNTTGKLSLLQGTVFSGIREHSGDEALRAYAEANREGQAWLVRQLEHRGVAVDRRTAFTYAPQPEQLEMLEREHDAALASGVEAVFAEETGLPFEPAGALELAGQVQLHPLVVLQELSAELRERGGTIVERCPVRDVRNGTGVVEVVSERGSVIADICVLATGVPILDRGMFFAKLEPSRSFAAAYRLAESRAPQGMYLSIGEPRSLRTAADKTGAEVLIVGGGAHITGRGDGTRQVRAIDDWTSEHFVGARRVTWWAAQDYRSHSRLPYAGVLPRGGGRIYTATGFNKWGMTNGVAAALTIAADVLGGRLDWAETLRDHALRLPAVKDAIAANAAVAAHLVSDWAAAELRGAEALEGLAEGEGAVVREGAVPVGIAKVDGRICRVSGVCTHLGGVLNWNAAERSWDCPLHGSRFSADGRRLEGPALDDLSAAGESRASSEASL